ncbi:leucine-rich repeat protein 1 [Lingula anatina]|uniref:Leucine-rich repeat protein 1 n=1 Tax=Lingula anatina TaxID=7574 RepID=A0A1S3JIP8_LINAN|nr:leucine-rich repeat protein 1 [Lingula anatina]XP_023932881.1 leucine-rich repeat protein 1 [Lingula anatina]|eukprot:XP_023932880.1 leucine-rich repeat protein 1 [Lingula anatina]
MRITCEADIGNRLLPSFNMRGKTKFTRTQLSVGKKPSASGESKEGVVYLMMCTAKDRNGTKYVLKNNIEQLFMKFIDEGKATIRLKDPPHDICLCKADPIQLKSFLNVVKVGALGRDLGNITLSTLAPASAKQVEKPKTRMTILKRKDYPLTTGFPSSLEFLTINGCSLKKVDSRIIQLKHLSHLNLSGNCLTSLPVALGELQHLTELDVSDNQIEQFPQPLGDSSLRNSLTFLNISKNKLKFLPPSFCALSSLVTLNMNENQLQCLPARFGHLLKLRFLSAAKNSLKTLPGTFTQLLLEKLDLYCNEFLLEGPATAVDKLSFPSLLECAARSIKKGRVQHTEEDLPPMLLHFLKSAKLCLCGGYCFTSFVHYLARFDLRTIASDVVSLDAGGRYTAPVEGFLCSQRCYQEYQKRPFATMWGKRT